MGGSQPPFVFSSNFGAKCQTHFGPQNPQVVGNPPAVCSVAVFTAHRTLRVGGHRTRSSGVGGGRGAADAGAAAVEHRRVGQPRQPEPRVERQPDPPASPCPLFSRTPGCGSLKELDRFVLEGEQRFIASCALWEIHAWWGVGGRQTHFYFFALLFCQTFLKFWSTN